MTDRLKEQSSAEARLEHDPPIADLLGSIAAGDHAAFERLYRLTSAKSLGLAIRLLGDRQIAEEVLQDVYLTVWQKAAGFRPEVGSAAAWLATIVRHRSIDRLRLRRGSHSTSVDSPEALDALPAAADQLAEADFVASHSIARCLGALKDRQRTLILLAFYQGYTYDELARRTGHPLGTVKSDIRRGLADLKRCLER